METLREKERRSLYAVILIFTAMTAGIVAIGYLFHMNYEKKFRVVIENQLASIADMKIGQLVQWRKDSLVDASVFYKNASFLGLVQHYLEHPDDIEAQTELRTWLSQLSNSYEYDEVFLLDVHGAKRLSVPKSLEPACSFEKQGALEAIRSGQVEFVDFYRDDHNNGIFLALIVPILNEHDTDRAIGALVMRIDTQHYFNPFIQKWPTSSQTAETILVRRDGDNALYLTELKFREGSALERRISLEKQEYPAVKAVLGQKGIVDGIDYQGNKLIAYVRPIPDSPWFLVARIDSAEVYAPLRERLWFEVFLMGSLLVVALAGLGWIWKRRSARFYKERYESTEALLRSEERFKLLVQNAPVAIFVQTQQQFAYLNPTALNLFGAKTQYELLGQPVIDRFDPSSREIVKQRIHLLNEAKKPVSMVKEIYLRLDGCPFEVEVSAVPIRWGGHDGAMVFFRDITDHKRAREELRQSEFRFSRAELVAGLGNWEIDLATKRVTASNGARKIYGVGRQELTLDDIQEFPLPKYRSPLDEALHTLIKDGAPYDIQFKIKRANDNQVIDIHSIAHYDPEKNSVFGIMLDIPNLRHAEESHRLLFAAIEQAAEGIIITDAAGIIQYVNPAEEAITGYSRDELIGQKPSIFKPDKHDMKFYSNLWHTINAGKVWHGKFVNKKKDETEYHEDASISPVYDRSGNLTNFVCTVSDSSREKSCWSLVIE